MITRKSFFTCAVFLSVCVMSATADLEDALEGVDAALTEFEQADAAAAAEGEDTSPVAKKAEEDLDRAEQAKDNAQENLDQVNNNPKSSKWKKKSAQKKLDKATQAAEDAQEDADIHNDNTPGDSTDYRKALEKRREARRKLKAADIELRKFSRKLRGGFPSTENSKRKAAVRHSKVKRTLGGSITPPPEPSSTTSADITAPDGAGFAARSSIFRPTPWRRLPRPVQTGGSPSHHHH